jgi:hypothetical protein
MANLLWLQGGACSGNTMSFLNAEPPSVCDLVTDFGINIIPRQSNRAADIVLGQPDVISGRANSGLDGGSPRNATTAGSFLRATASSGPMR